VLHLGRLWTTNTNNDHLTYGPIPSILVIVNHTLHKKEGRGRCSAYDACKIWRRAGLKDEGEKNG